MPAFAVLLAYLIGSLPFGYLVAWIVSKEDIRTKGSGNIGATNVARVLGAKWGIMVLVLDAFKGLLPVWGLSRLFYSVDDPNFLHLQVACGLGTIVGHMFPCYLKFRGGKGVATSLGVILILSPWATLGAFGMFVTSILLWQIVSLSSMLAAVWFGAMSLWYLRPNPFSSQTWSLAVFSLLIPALILLRHRTNIKRLLKGEEPKFKSKRQQSPPPDVPAEN
jgi:acyl phosphate:glycerol-3-phosphate acyltransferase